MEIGTLAPYVSFSIIFFKYMIFQRFQNMLLWSKGLIFTHGVQNRVKDIQSQMAN